MLPKLFGRTSPATGAPIAASLVQSACGITTIIVFALAGWNPMNTLFFIVGTTGALGVFILMTAASGAVVGFFAHDRRGEEIWSSLLLPTVATILMLGCLWLIFDNYATLIGVPPTSQARWIPLLFVGVGVIGWGYGLWLRSRRPEVLQRVGHGANAALLDAAPLLSARGIA